MTEIHEHFTFSISMDSNSLYLGLYFGAIVLGLGVYWIALKAHK